jgi:hypothetical protein
MLFSKLLLLLQAVSSQIIEVEVKKHPIEMKAKTDQKLSIIDV